MKKYDVFISYAIEDKFPTAAGIAERLKKSGLNVYFVGDRLTAGDLISDTINSGLEQSHFCVLIVSPNYVRNWPAIERNHILYREKKEGRKLVFPVWNNITREDVARHFPELIDHYAPSTDTGLDAVAEHLQKAIHKRKSEEGEKNKVKEKGGETEQSKVTGSSTGKILLFMLAAILLLAFGYYALSDEAPRDPAIRNTHPLSPDN